jgi:hypothetical protein
MCVVSAQFLCAPPLYVRFLCVLRIPVGFVGHPGRLRGTRPPDSPSNPSKISSSDTVALSPTLRSPNSFRGNTYKFPRKYCKQRTYVKANSFKCNTYKK